MNMQNTITRQLEDSFTIEHLNVENESYMHNVPAGSESHFKVTIVSPDFTGLMLIKRHRLVNSALKQTLQDIHALALHTLTPDEWFERAGRVADSPLCEGGGKD